uniref:NADH-ubiquinone oxidoreductase chain 4 n=1 Tax=Rhipiphorothrips cruentatus TaxID=764491 RepID=A0A8A5L8H2_9NEOP|nr:NADH dehydrogenase subunit 4 [Rhipiphorothrips cruentatus]
MLKILILMLVFIHFFLFNMWTWYLGILVFSFLILVFLSYRLFLYGYMSDLFFFDKVGLGLVILSLLIILCCFLSSGFVFYSSYLNYYLFSLSLLMVLMVLSFMVSNFFFFFFLFEFSLIPTLYLILGWGSKVERIQSGLYMFFYTMFGSLPLLIGLMMIYKFFGLFNLIYFNFWGLNFFFCLCFFLAFLIKLPMFLFHSWLPKAHVEAPVTGSMILAGILLKLGGYGLFRLLNYFLVLNENLVIFFVSLSILGGLISGLICFRQIDMKSLVAYSSVSHMSMIVCSVFTLNHLGIFGSLILMISHGFCSSGLFFLVNLNYERVMSRSMIMNKGLLSFMPSLGLWWFLFLSINMSCPPSMNLISEILIFNSIFSWSFLTWFYLFFMPFISMLYSLNMFSFSQHGKILSLMNYIYPCFLIDYLIIFIHFLPLALMYLNLTMFF